MFIVVICCFKSWLFCQFTNRDGREQLVQKCGPKQSGDSLDSQKNVEHVFLKSLAITSCYNSLFWFQSFHQPVYHHSLSRLFSWAREDNVTIFIRLQSSDWLGFHCNLWKQPSMRTLSNLPKSLNKYEMQLATQSPGIKLNHLNKFWSLLKWFMAQAKHSTYCVVCKPTSRQFLTHQDTPLYLHTDFVYWTWSKCTY